MSKLAAVQDTGFGGLDARSTPLLRESANTDKNGSHQQMLCWETRRGFAKSALSKLAYPAYGLRWFKSKDGINRLVLFLKVNGRIDAADLPSNRWGVEPKILSGRGFTFNPVADLLVSDTSGLTLTWTNPTNTYWRGTKVLRRTDGIYPQGPRDFYATTVYDGRLNTYTDAALTVGATGYYAVFSYSRRRWGVPAHVAGTRT